MKKILLISAKFLFILFALVSIGLTVKAQTDSAKWLLSADQTAINVGNVIGDNQTLSSWLEIRDYGGAPIKQRIRINSIYTGQSAAGWPASVTSELSDVYIDFPASPKPGYKFHVNTISLDIIGQGTGSMKANIYISTDPTFARRTVIFESGSTGLGQTSMTAANSIKITGLDTIVNDGKTIYLRIYPWYNSGSVSNTRYINIQNVVIKGTTETAGAVTAPSAPNATAATGISSTGFTANWDAAATVTGYKLDVATDNAFTSKVAGFDDKDVANVTTYNVTGLTAGTTYYYRVRAYNTGGTSASSNTITASTSSASVAVTGIAVTGADGATTITTNAGTLQMSAAVTPTDASNKEVTWSVTNGTGEASINTTGLLTAVKNGTVTVRATAKDGSNVFGELAITISGQTVAVTGITVTGAGGATTITTSAGTLQMSAAVTPADAVNKEVTWSVTPGTGDASINTSGLLTATKNGTVTVRATAKDGSNVSGELAITISGQTVAVTGITVAGANGATTITTNAGTLQMSAAVTPADAVNKDVTWSVTNGTGQASINTSGLLTASKNGTVTVKATAKDGSNVSGELVITISGQTVAVTGITVTGANGAITITTNAGTLQMSAAVTPADATNKDVTWSVTNGTGQASINTSGLLTASKNGTVTVKATAKDGSNVFGELAITISGQTVAVTGITVTGANGATTITTNAGTLQMSAAVTPADATNKDVTWSVTNGTGQASINTTGLLTASKNGTVTVKATAKDGTNVFGELVITISGQGTGISDLKTGKYVITPNPVDNEIILNEASGIVRYEVIALNGRVLKQSTNNSDRISVDVSNLVPGVYVFKVYTSGDSRQIKFLKK